MNAAQKQLPPDTRALVVILSDIARAGLNRRYQDRESRGELADAIAAAEPTARSSALDRRTAARAV